MSTSMKLERVQQDLYETLEELRREALVALRVAHPSDAVDSVLDGELAETMKRATRCAEEFRRLIDEAAEEHQNRRDGYGTAD